MVTVSADVTSGMASRYTTTCTCLSADQDGNLLQILRNKQAFPPRATLVFATILSIEILRIGLNQALSAIDVNHRYSDCSTTVMFTYE